MIILHEEDEHQAKLDSLVAGSTLRYPEKAVRRSSSSLPDYEASEAQHRLKPPPKESKGVRLLKATFYALAIYVALSAVIALPILMTRKKKPEGIDPHIPNPASLWADRKSQPIASPPPSFASSSLIPYSSSTSDCSSWQKIVNNTGKLQATLQQRFSPASSIAIRSNISSDDYQVTPGVFGSLTVDMNPDHKATEIVINLVAHTSNYTLLQQTNICINNNISENGLTIYAPGNLTGSQFLSFDVQLLFPRRSVTYTVPQLTTYLPQFHQYFEPLSSFVTFHQVSIFGTQSDITCKSIEAPQIGVKNVRAAITGNFSVSSSLILDTIFGAITSNITLTSNADPPSLILDTGNAPIHADVSLSSSSSTPLAFVGSVKTFSAPINLSFINLPSTMLPLRLFVANNAAPTNVTLDQSYQGCFDIQSKLAPVSVNTPKQPHFEIVYDTQSYERISGDIRNGSRPSRGPGDGRIEVVSALGPVFLNIGAGDS